MYSITLDWFTLRVGDAPDKQFFICPINALRELDNHIFRLIDQKTYLGVGNFVIYRIYRIWGAIWETIIRQNCRFGQDFRTLVFT